MMIHTISDNPTDVDRKPTFVNRVSTFYDGESAGGFGILTHQLSHRHKM